MSRETIQVPIPRVCNCSVDAVAEYAEDYGVEEELEALKAKMK